jgi:hypothetical protein
MSDMNNMCLCRNEGVVVEYTSFISSADKIVHWYTRVTETKTYTRTLNLVLIKTTRRQTSLCAALRWRERERVTSLYF